MKNNRLDSNQMNDEIAIDIQLSDIFNIVDLQKMQDLFSDAMGVASIITQPDGRPITKPSNFTRLVRRPTRRKRYWREGPDQRLPVRG
jgi:hypothetical protein